MGLPTAERYAMPDEDTLPRSVAPWKVDPGRAALLIHDMQHHLLQVFPPGVPPLVDLVANVARLRDAAHRLGLPVVFSAEPPISPDRRGPAHRPAGPHVDGGGAATPRDGRIAASPAPSLGEHVITNTRDNAFLRSHLERILRTSGRDQLIVCGLFAHSGILLTAADAYMNDIQPFVVADAVADVSAEEHALALRWSAARGAVVRTTTTLIDELEL
ncbi:isochorismatase family protein [Streptomyces sp. CA-243310]|uniref:isochorismatase family protein n=1 Tax=Streptomyces sp. CA-243310 TaxID=3240056 RepID=UPI003D94FE6F